MIGHVLRTSGRTTCFQSHPGESFIAQSCDDGVGGQLMNRRPAIRSIWGAWPVGVACWACGPGRSYSQLISGAVTASRPAPTPGPHQRPTPPRPPPRFRCAHSRTDWPARSPALPTFALVCAASRAKCMLAGLALITGVRSAAGCWVQCVRRRAPDTLALFVYDRFLWLSCGF